MLKVTSRPQIHTTEPSTKEVQIQFRQDLPNWLEPIINALYNPVPSFFNAKLLKSKHCSEILQYAISWPTLESFYFNQIENHGNSNFPLLKQLTIIYFPNLQYLDLENMKLDNFQFLQFIDSPNLKTVYLIKNNVKILKSFGKINWKKLQKLELDYDFGVQELKYLERTRFALNGKVINPLLDSELKKRKKIDQSKIMNSLLMVWPKLESKFYGHLIEDKMKRHNKRQQ